jgi:GH15 family glucan-1,4-alpha-glucosidase
MTQNLNYINSPEKPLLIEDYAIIGDCITSALVGKNGSIDWLCWPRFDSGACFAAILGDSNNGRWKIAPVNSIVQVTRAYRDNGLILETKFSSVDSEVVLIDFMPWDVKYSTIIRMVHCLKGQMDIHMDLCLRFDYGSFIPWVKKLENENGITAIAGPNLAVLRTSVPLHGTDDFHTVSDFHLYEGQKVSFVLSDGPSHMDVPPVIDAEQALQKTEEYWHNWLLHCTYHGPYRKAVIRSLITLKALTFETTGSIIAAPTTSLPEYMGGVRNWDYRFCWLRDAALTLFALMRAGYYDEAAKWRDWLHRSVAGNPAQIRIMYGLSGERILPEWTVPWLSGYEDSTPVRVGNAASEQLQLDVYGEVINALHHARSKGLTEPERGWNLQIAMLEHLEKIWQEPDASIWEVRGCCRHFTFSKVMVWVAFDRAILDMQQYNLPGPLERWKSIRDQIHQTVCEHGYNSKIQSFVQSFDTENLDAALLLIPLVGFLPPEDPRVINTITAIEKHLVINGFVLRYHTEENVDGLPPGEGAFLACSFWLASAYKLIGRDKDAHALFQRLLSLRNDVGLLSEEYDPITRRLTGNFPQAFSHLAMVGAALRLGGEHPTDRGDMDPTIQTSS